MISAKVITDSKNEFGNRITTMVVTMPRIILAEFNTHRMFSRNSTSSRAIPFEKMVKSVEENPFIPIAWQKDHKGMQGVEYFSEDDVFNVDKHKWEWLRARDHAISKAKELNNTGVTKQLCNRLLEPFMWHTVIVTATEWENFFALRCPQYEFNNITYRSWKDVAKEGTLDSNANDLYKLSRNKGQAEIHMMALAEAMWDAYNVSTPKELKAGEWHIPFGDNIIGNEITITLLKLIPDRHLTNDDYEKSFIKIATARCARVSYTVVGEEGKPDNYENDIKLHDRLASYGHWSPFEHCARAMSLKETLGHIRSDVSQTNPDKIGKYETGWSGNFLGFIQYRKMFENENITRDSR